MAVDGITKVHSGHLRPRRVEEDGPGAARTIVKNAQKSFKQTTISSRKCL